MRAAPDLSRFQASAARPTLPGCGACEDEWHDSCAMGQELDEINASLVELARLHENCAAPAEQFAIEQGKAKVGWPYEHDNALWIAGWLGPAFLHGLKDRRQGHGVLGMYFIHFLGVLSFERFWRRPDAVRGAQA
jgi:hypothetical protein